MKKGLKIYNTLTRNIDEFEPLEGDTVRIYSCGPTVYDYAHIGNFRTYVVNDILRRYLKFLGYKVVHVMNITDVDDKTIKGANEKGVSLKEYTSFYEEEFFKDLKALNIERTEYTPRATEHIDEMLEMISKLYEKGIAYEKDGSIYYSISKFPEYGKLSKIDISGIKAGARVEVDEYKEDVRDFALWKAKKEGEPYWKSPFGEGRPGWHIECSAMSRKYLGNPFDIHTGGVDLIFPHHENEIAQTEGAYDVEMTRYWFHIEHLIVEGKKMSKSLGNFYTLRDILNKGYSPREVRYLLMSAHYRKKLNFTFEGLESAKNALQRIDSFLLRINTEKKEGSIRDTIKNKTEELIKGFIESMNDDLNISEALGKLFSFIKDINSFIDKEGITTKEAEEIENAFQSLDKVLGVIYYKPEAKKDLSEDEILKLIKEREEARKQKNYAKADQIRDFLKSKGIILEDTPAGTRWRYA